MQSSNQKFTPFFHSQLTSLLKKKEKKKERKKLATCHQKSESLGSTVSEISIKHLIQSQMSWMQRKLHPKSQHGIHSAFAAYLDTLSGTASL